MGQKLFFCKLAKNVTGVYNKEKKILLNKLGALDKKAEVNSTRLG
jgi:hypothetical protein